MRVSDFVSSSFDRFDQQYNTACSRANSSGSGPSSSSSTNNNNGSNNNHVLTAAEVGGNSRRIHSHNGDVAAEDMAPMSFAHSILLDLLRRSNNDLQNYGGTTSLPLLFIALARVVIALLSLLLSICGIVLHVLLAVTIRILFVVVDGFSLVQRALWSVVERVVTVIAIRMDWQQHPNNHLCDHNRRCNLDHNHNNHCISDDFTSASTNGEKRRGGSGGGGGILESYRKHILQQLAHLTSSSTTTTRTKLDGLPDIMNNTPPSLSLFAFVTALAFIVHPDGLTWIVLGKLCEGLWLGLQLLRGAATTIVAAALSSPSQEENGSGGGSSIGSETLSTIVASAVLASLIMLGKVMYRALYKKNTVTDTQSSSSSLGTSSASSSKKKKGRRGRNSGRHGNHHHNRSGQRNNRKDATTADSTTTTTTTSRTDSSSSLPTHPSPKQQPSSSSRSLSPSCSTRTNSTTSFVEEKETSVDDAIPKPKVTTDDDEASDKEESKERTNNVKKDNVSPPDSNACSNNGNGKSSAAAQQLPHDPAHDILSKLRPDSTDSLSVPQLLDEDVSLGSSVAGSLVVDCGTKQGGGTSRSGGSNNTTTKKRGGARGKYHGGGNMSTNGMVRAPPGFITKDSMSSSTKSATLPRNTAHVSRGYPGKNLSLQERQNDDRKQKQPFSPKRKPDTNHEHHGTRTRASTSDCVIRHYDANSSPHLNSYNGTTTTAGNMVSPAPSFLLSGQHLLQHEQQRVRIASNNELSSPYRTSHQVSHESSFLKNGTMRNNLNSPISPPVIRPPPGLGFGSPVEMSSFGHGGVGGVELAPTTNNHSIPGPTLSLSPPERIRPHPQAQQYSSYDQSNFLLQPSVFPSISNNHKMKESPTNEDDRIDADLQELGDQMVGSVLDF